MAQQTGSIMRPGSKPIKTYAKSTETLLSPAHQVLAWGPTCAESLKPVFAGTMTGSASIASRLLRALAAYSASLGRFRAVCREHDLLQVCQWAGFQTLAGCSAKSFAPTGLLWAAQAPSSRSSADETKISRAEASWVSLLLPAGWPCKAYSQLLEDLHFGLERPGSPLPPFTFTPYLPRTGKV